LGAWSFIACIIVITIDVITRKLGFQLPGLGSTRLQELEWQLHTLLFSTWLGYAYVRNAHVRIDVFTGGMDAHRKIKLELLCCLLVALPYLAIALPYSHSFFMTSFLQGESSEAPNGIPYRWIVKFFLYGGLVLVAMAVFTVISRCIVALYGNAEQVKRVHLPFAN
jgi:TRAP-type mannitol/chloroaromatic compound transport system permease small subunit